MSEDRMIELEIKLAYQEDLVQSLNTEVALQQVRLGKLEETCRLLHEKILQLQAGDRQSPISERPPHY